MYGRQLRHTPLQPFFSEIVGWIVQNDHGRRQVEARWVGGHSLERRVMTETVSISLLS